MSDLSNIRLYSLPPDEWSSLGAAYEGCGASEALPLPNPEQSIIIGAGEAGRLVGCVGAERTWHVSPFWLERRLRGSGLAECLASEIAEHNTEGLTELLVTTNRHVELLVFNMGFIPIPGVIWRRKK